MHLRKTATSLLLLILIALAISPSFALGEGNRNLLLIGVMSISPIIIIYFGRFDRINPWLGLFLVSILVFPPIFHPESMRWSTILYSVMFVLTFIAYQELLYHSYFTPLKYLKLLKYILLSYFIVLLIQQMCVVLGFPIFNLSNYNPLEPWKLNSLSAEPSHSARIVALLMYCYITMKELILNRKYNFKFDSKKDIWLWIAFVWTMLTMGSGTAFVFITIIFLKFVRFKKLVPAFIVGLVLFFLIDYFELQTFDRSKDIFLATITLNEEKIIEADHSASFRIVPILVLVKMVNFTTLNAWFGHGIDHVKTFMYQYMPGGGDEVAGGGLLATGHEYGLLALLFFVVFSLQVTLSKNNEIISSIFWFMLVFLNSMNSQILWLCLILFITNKHFYQSYSFLRKLNNG